MSIILSKLWSILLYPSLSFCPTYPLLRLQYLHLQLNSLATLTLLHYHLSHCLDKCSGFQSWNTLKLDIFLLHVSLQFLDHLPKSSYSTKYILPMILSFKKDVKAEKYELLTSTKLIPRSSQSSSISSNADNAFWEIFLRSWNNTSKWSMFFIIMFNSFSLTLEK